MSLTLGQALGRATQTLSGVSDSPRRDAELLLSMSCGRSRATLFAYDRDPLAEAEAAQFFALVAQRARAVPLAYLSGIKEFWSLPLTVTPEVLVPRPETEQLVQWALELTALDSAADIVDLGTGSGAIALALASERPQAAVYATDLSPGALVVAQGNARKLALDVRFSHGAWYEALPPNQCFDLIVSNPPYIAAGDAHLPALHAEPRMALTDEADGLSALRELIAGAPTRLRCGGHLLLEHGWDQGEAVRALLRASGLVQVQTRHDLSGQERVSGGRRP